MDFAWACSLNIFQTPVLVVLYMCRVWESIFDIACMLWSMYVYELVLEDHPPRVFHTRCCVECVALLSVHSKQYVDTSLQLWNFFSPMENTHKVFDNECLYVARLCSDKIGDAALRFWHFPVLVIQIPSILATRSRSCCQWCVLGFYWTSVYIYTCFPLDRYTSCIRVSICIGRHVIRPQSRARCREVSHSDQGGRGWIQVLRAILFPHSETRHGPGIHGEGMYWNGTWKWNRRMWGIQSKSLIFPT